MKSFDYDAVVYDGEIYCLDCLPDGIDVNSEEVHPIFADSEWDYAPVCTVCGQIHDYMTILEDVCKKCRPESEWECEQCPHKLYLDERADHSGFDAREFRRADY